MGISRAYALAGVLAWGLALSGCAAAVVGDASGAHTPAASTSTTGGDTTTPAAPTAMPSDGVTAPVPKVERAGVATAPTVTAPEAATSDAAVYSDGVILRIVGVVFGTETAQGPGASTGREYVRLTLELTNGSGAKIDMSSTVVTVLDQNGTRLTPVYAADSGAQDFSDSVASGAAIAAVYVVAAPADRGAAVTIAVDFDAVHTSAIFRGPLG